MIRRAPHDAVAAMIPSAGVGATSAKLAARYGDEAAEAVEWTSSYHLYFSQKGVSPSTRSGIALDVLAQDIAQGWRGDPLRVVEHEGKLMSLDNRRLAAAKLVGADVPIRRVSLDDPEIKKILRKRDGIQSSILVRGTNMRIDVSGRVFEQ